MSINTKKARIIFIMLFVLWTLLAALYSASQYREFRSNILELATQEANLAFLKDTLYRRWVSSHGGVYVPVSEYAKPNPYLSIPDRDVVTQDGKRLTLINPAYMTRQVYEMAGRNVIQGHLTSDKLLNPVNQPDPWEAEALKSVLNGADAYSGVDTIDGEPYLRYMRPFMTEENCLKCHAQQGYKVGDVRGGISVSVPLKHYYTTFEDKTLLHAMVNFAAWLFGALLLWFSHSRLSALLVKEEMLVREKDTILHELNHRVKNNLQIIASIIDIHKGRSDHFDTDELLEDIQGRLVSMSAMHSMFVSEQEQMGVDSAKYFSMMVDHFKDTYGIRTEIDVKINLDADSVILSGTQAVSCGLILNELLTNSYKYAFRNGNPSPEINISFKVKDGKVDMIYRDNGSGFDYKSSSEKPDSYGFLMITSMAVKLRGKIDISGEEGMRMVMSFFLY